MSEFAWGQLPFVLATGQTKVGQMCVARVYWFDPGTTGDTFTLTDITGNVILVGRCESSGQSQFFDFSAMPITVNGVGVLQLSSGTLYIYPC